MGKLLKTCAICHHEKHSCTCANCSICGYEFSELGNSTRIGRHHCFAPGCGRPCCASCREQTPRKISDDYDLGKFCKRCAPLSGLTKLLEHQSTERNGFFDPKPPRGLFLLFDAVGPRFPRRCLNSLTCRALSNEATCQSCELPTLPTEPFVEKLPLVSPEPDTQMHREALAAERQMEKVVEKRFADPKKLAALEEQVFSTFSPPLQKTGMTELQWRDLLLCHYASSMAYEYSRWPRLTLNASLIDCQVPMLLRVLDVHASYTVLEAPNDRIIIAFPGTHNSATLFSDLNAGRTFVSENVKVHNGLVVDNEETEEHREHEGYFEDKNGVSGSVTPLWKYKVHSGFQKAASQLEHRLPTSVIKNFIVKQGKRVLLTGHSLASALSTLTVLRMARDEPDIVHMKHKSKNYNNNKNNNNNNTSTSAAGENETSCSAPPPALQHVGLGSPLIGNTALKHRVEQGGLSHLFLFVVAKGDIVPRLACVRKTQQEMVQSISSSFENAKESANKAIGNAKSKFVDTVSPMFKRVSSFFGSKKEEVGNKQPQEMTTTTTTTASTTVTTAAAAAASNSLTSSLNSSTAGLTSGGGGGGGGMLSKQRSVSPSTACLDPMSHSPLTISPSLSSCFTNPHQHRGGGGGKQQESSTPPPLTLAKSAYTRMKELELDADDSHLVSNNNNNNVSSSGGFLLSACASSGGGVISTSASASGLDPISASPTGTLVAPVSSLSSASTSPSSSPQNTLAKRAPPSPYREKTIVKSPFDIFGNWLFLAPTVESPARLREKEQQEQSASGGASVVSASASSGSSPSSSPSATSATCSSSSGFGFQGSEKMRQRIHEAERLHNAMRTPCFLLSDSAECFTTVRNSTSKNGFSGSISDHLLHCYQRVLILACMN